MQKSKGFVYLVGGGPGDPGLLTIKAAKAIARAEVVVYDRLVHPAIVDMVPAACKKIFVGKAPGAHAATQEEINGILVEHGLAGKLVVRLKGGDPFVFGRGGEEAIALQQADLPFAIIPGISSSVAAAEYAGIPITHRGVADHFTISTGHVGEGRVLDPEKLSHLAASGGTLVFLMGIEQLENITKGLLEAGLAADTPAAVVANGTLADQQVLRADLGSLVAECRSQGIKPPAVTLIGNVCSLESQIKWQQYLPWSGRRILFTRPAGKADPYMEMFELAGAEVLQLPMIGIEEIADSGLDAAISRIAGYVRFVFSSAEGVGCFVRALKRCGLDARALTGARFASVGPASAAALQSELGINCDIVADIHTQEGLAEAIVAQEKPCGRGLYIRSEAARDYLMGTLAQAGFSFDQISAYRPVLLQPTGQFPEAVIEMIRRDKLDWVVLASPSTAEALAGWLAAHDLKIGESGLSVACTGPITAAACDKLGMTVAAVAKAATPQALVEAMNQAEERPMATE